MQETLYNGFRRIDFTFEGREALLIFPEKPNENKNWLLKTEYFSAFPDFQIQMLHRGWHLAFIKNITRWCLEEDLDLKKRFAEYLHAEYGLCEKCVPVGMSCGGLIGSKFAAKYPEKVSALYLDAPVMNLLSCPAGLGIAENSLYPEFAEATGMTVSDLICYREHPIDKMHLLLENKIPVVLVYGDSDTVVPYKENGALLEKYYKENGGVIEVYGKAGCGHHPHGLEDNTPIIEFVEKYSI
ncbi:MAG: alpha/beta hydrolase [Oscillospiraceae bacterium]|nr:alpha/beta hydrolase [Oscillospiraceae bacterium]